MKWFKCVLASAVLLCAMAEEGISQEFQYLSSLDAGFIAEGSAEVPNPHVILQRQSGFTATDLSLNDALAALSQRARVTLAFSEEFIPDRRVSCDCRTLSVAQTLDRLLQDTSLTYRTMMGSHVVIEPADSVAGGDGSASLSALRLSARAAPRSLNGLMLRRPNVSVRRARQGDITGMVTDATTGQPLQAVEIYIEETETVALSTTDGSYRFSDVPAGTYTVVARRIGYQQVRQEEVTVVDDEEVTVNFQLTQLALALDEIVVVGYGAQARETVTGSISQLSAADLERTSATTTGEALMGRMPGINTRRGYQGRGFGSNPAFEGRDGRPGAPVNLQIRNLGDPLYVIDGVPREAHDFNALNSRDIETLSVLKDAAASVYGFRAANGVILVETKRGSAVEQAPELSVDGYYGWQNISRTNYPFGYGVTAYQQIYSVLEHEQNIGVARSRTPEEMEEWLHAPTYETWDEVVNNPNAMQANVNVSLSGGTGDARYYLSLGHVNQDYTMLDNNYNRSNVQANLQAQVFEGLEMGVELAGRIENHENIAGTAHSDPVVMLFRAVQSPHSHQPFYANHNPNFIAGDVRILARTPPAQRRAIAGYQDQFRRNVSGNFWAEYTLPFGTRIRGTISQQYNDFDLEFQTRTFDGYCYDEAEDTYDVCGSVASASRRAFRDQTEGTFGQLMVSHSQQLGAHSLSGTVAYEFDGSEMTRHDVGATPPLNSSHLINQTDVNDYSNDWGIERRASFVGRLNYDYEQKYLLEVLGRYDGSYLYAEDNRWGLFPGVSLGWRVTEESFMENRFDFLDELKPRLSWGQTGREQGVNPWGYLGGATFGAGSGAILDGRAVTGVRPRGLPVTNLSWVKSTTRNVGLDFVMFGGMISGEVDLFERKLTGLPASRDDVVLPVELGYSLPNENLESEANRGLEFILRYSNNIGNLSYTLSPNFTVARRRILDRYLPRYGNSWDRYRSASEDRWDDVDFGYQVIGQFQSMEEVANHPVDIDGEGNASLLPGDWIYNDANGDGVIDGLDQRPIGWPGGTPILQYGLGGTFGYGPFTLAVDVYGGSMFSHNADFDRRIPYNADHGGAAYWNSRWRRADVFDDNSEWIPGRYPPLRRGQQNHSSYRSNDFTLTNVNYLRLNRVELSYDVSADVASRLRLSQTRVYVSATNPWVKQFYSQNWAQDPEAGGNQIYPPSKVVNIGFSTALGGGR